MAAISVPFCGKILDLSNDDPSMYFELDPEQFIKDLKQLDPHNWDPLPINIMCVNIFGLYNLTRFEQELRCFD